MKVLMIMDGDDCVLRIEPEDEEGRALLATFGVKGHFQSTLGSVAVAPVLSAAQVGAFYEGTPLELD
ncbi:MAG: hypothetical protein H6942_04910 [Candidatus Accumulibacter sp.]|uniref:hypothetical protein n=1 Tax=Accumulibacter sp. TaxID=2053492 RepID=UPI0019E6B022|nr:hypothetical protein [Accumulibacter sp.]MBE2260579.1 hypothetical protein [Paracoccaceae bacterium]MCB1943055.1 hypothetical protein [Accumulibacter sp.]MCP5247872.1 hypothetical protein [Accumulibacter sp.]